MRDLFAATYVRHLLTQTNQRGPVYVHVDRYMYLAYGFCIHVVTLHVFVETTIY
jgi:hypothetical protein